MLSDRPLTPGRRMREAADDEVDFDAGLRGLVERLDDARARAGHSSWRRCGRGGRPGRAPVSRRMRPRKLSAMVSGRDEQRAVVVDLGVGGEVVEDHVHALGDLRDRR